eukprot:47273_1
MLRRIGNDTTQDERSSSFKFRMQKHELISRCHAIIYRLCPMIRDIEKLMSSNDPSITVIGRILSESRVIRTRSHVGLSCQMSRGFKMFWSQIWEVIGLITCGFSCEHPAMMVCIQPTEAIPSAIPTTNPSIATTKAPLTPTAAPCLDGEIRIGHQDM